MVIGLFKNGKLVDYGVLSKIRQYQQLGFEVRALKYTKATYAFTYSKFIQLWDSLSKKVKHMYKHLITDKMSIYDRLLKLEAVVAKLQSSTPPQKRKSFVGQILTFIKSKGGIHYG